HPSLHATTAVIVCSGFLLPWSGVPRDLHSFPTRRSSDLSRLTPSSAFRCPSRRFSRACRSLPTWMARMALRPHSTRAMWLSTRRSEEHTSELQSRENLVCRLLLEKKNNARTYHNMTGQED